MFICCDNCLFNSDNINFIKVNERDITIGLTNANHLLKYKNGNLAKRAYSKIRVAITKSSSIVDISENKLEEEI